MIGNYMDTPFHLPILLIQSDESGRTEAEEAWVSPSGESLVRRMHRALLWFSCNAVLIIDWPLSSTPLWEKQATVRLELGEMRFGSLALGWWWCWNRQKRGHAAGRNEQLQNDQDIPVTSVLRHFTTTSTSMVSCCLHFWVFSLWLSSISFVPLWLRGKSTVGLKPGFLTGEPWAIQFPSGVNMQIGGDSQDSSSINIMRYLVPHASPGALAYGLFSLHNGSSPSAQCSGNIQADALISDEKFLAFTWQPGPQTNLFSVKLPS